ncbi:MAG: hypothetical protein ACJARP_002691 [Vicingaceae bacterium]|jgi:hypothetical protein
MLFFRLNFLNVLIADTLHILAFLPNFIVTLLDSRKAIAPLKKEDTSELFFCGQLMARRLAVKYQKKKIQKQLFSGLQFHLSSISASSQYLLPSVLHRYIVFSFHQTVIYNLLLTVGLIIHEFEYPLR